MRKKTLMICSLLVSAMAFAAERQAVWPEGKIPDFQKHQYAATTKERAQEGFKASEWTMPYLDWYDAPAAEVRSDACMILISGGSYECCCDWKWIDRIAKRLTEMGVRCVSLVYRTPRPKGLPIYQTGWQDGQRAVRIVRSRAKELGFNPEKIGVLGFSAGSHLTLMLATSSTHPAYKPIDDLDSLSCHINWAIPIYPAYALDDGLAGPNTRDGDAIDVKMNSSFKFDAKTCSMCLFHGGTDVYSPNGSTQVYRQLRRMKIPAELHLYADRGHGFMGNNPGKENSTGYDNWFARAEEYLLQMGFIGKMEPLEERRIFTGLHTAERVVEKLWPKGKMPDAQAQQKVEPTMEWFIPKELKTKAIQIITPGGAYSHCNASGEGLPVAEYLNSKGMTAVVVTYRTPRPSAPLAKHTTAWQDAQRAIRLVRKAAPSRGLDPNRIGIMGFSAGGHLTLMCATSSRRHAYRGIDDVDKISCRVQWACPIYPAYSLSDGIDSPNKSGGNDDSAVPVAEFSFDLDTPPMCFVHGDADVWAAMNSVKCWEKLRRMGIQSDLHTLAKRGHCFQFKASPNTGSYTWLDRIWEFMNHKGFNK